MIPENMLRKPELAQLETKRVSLRGLALAVVLGGTGPLLAQQ